MTSKLLLSLLLIFSLPAFAEDAALIEKKNQSVIDLGVHPGDVADAIIILVPEEDIALNRSHSEKRPIRGKITSNERSIIAVDSIFQPPFVIISPLKRDTPVKMFLKRYPNSNDYYPIGIFPVSFPSEKQK